MATFDIGIQPRTLLCDIKEFLMEFYYAVETNEGKSPKMDTSYFQFYVNGNEIPTPITEYVEAFRDLYDHIHVTISAKPEDPQSLAVTIQAEVLDRKKPILISPFYNLCMDLHDKNKRQIIYDRDATEERIKTILMKKLKDGETFPLGVEVYLPQEHTEHHVKMVLGIFNDLGFYDVVDIQTMEMDHFSQFKHVFHVRENNS